MKIIYELGDKVEFSSCYKKAPGYVDINNLTEEQSIEFDNSDFVTLIRQQKTELLKPLTGIVCGIRNIVVKSEIAESPETDYCSDSRGVNNQFFEPVLLVAVNMNCFYRVSPEWVKLADKILNKATS